MKTLGSIGARVAQARAQMDAAGPNEFVEIDLLPLLIGQLRGAGLTNPAAVPRETWRSRALGG